MADPAEGLEPDITTIEDEAERKRMQMEYYGGDLDDDEDELQDLGDRGDNLESEEPVGKDRGDELQAEKEEEDEEPEAEDDDADADDDAEDDQADSDEDDESEEEDVSEDDDESEDDDGKQSKDDDRDDPRIPLSRFNEVNERMKRAEQRLAELEKQEQAQEQAAKEQYDFDAAEEEYMELLLDGKTKEAGAKRREIRVAEQELFKTETKQETIQEADHQQEMRELNSLSLQAEEMYPIFNQESPQYDAVAANRVVTYMKGYMADGMPVTDAFVSGLSDVIVQYNLDGAGKEAAPEEKPKAPTSRKGKPIKKVKEKVSAAKQQGQTPAGKGEGSADRGVAAPSIEDMSDEDLDRLSPEQMARLRGDYVE